MINLHLLPRPRICLSGPQIGPITRACTGATLLDTLVQAKEELTRIGYTHKMTGAYPHLLPETFDQREGYILSIDERGIAVYCDHHAALYYAEQTLYQIIIACAGAKLPVLTLIDWPSLPLRGAHICYHLVTENMPHLAPDFANLLIRIQELAHFKMNCVLLEIEALFPYRQDHLACQLALTQDQIKLLNQVCAACHVQIIPLVQCIGHNYFVLRHPEYAHLREVPNTSQQYCISSQAVKDFYLDLVGQVIEAFPDSAYFHIGADETWNLGHCPHCRRLVNEHGLASVYSTYINDICTFLRVKGKLPIMWSDMLELHPDVIPLLNSDVILMYWNYDVTNNIRPYVLQVQISQFATIAASAARFGAVNHAMYHYATAMSSTGMLVGEAVHLGAAGFIITDWMKSVPYELTMPTLVYAAALTWNDACSLAAYETSFGIRYFGVAHAHYARVMHLLAGHVPYCEDAQMRQPDAIERYDQTGLTIGERIRRYTAKCDSQFIEKGFKEILNGEAKHFKIMLTYEKTLASMRSAMQHAQEALQLLACEQPARNQRVFALLSLSARTIVHKARMGLLFDACQNLLKYPAPGDLASVPQLAAELSALCQQWQDLREETERLLLPGTFAPVVKNVLDVKFEPDALEWMHHYQAELLRFL
jgi:hypothetical protein